MNLSFVLLIILTTYLVYQISQNKGLSSVLSGKKESPSLTKALLVPLCWFEQLQKTFSSKMVHVWLLQTCVLQQHHVHSNTARHLDVKRRILTCYIQGAPLTYNICCLEERPLSIKDLLMLFRANTPAFLLKKTRNIQSGPKS